jgi:curli production assembly/transport component CsgG
MWNALLTRHAVRLAGLLALAALGGCVANGNPLLDTPPVLAKITPVNDRLRELPPPDRKVSVAVYNFDDLTGQYKELDNVQTLSRAVTQGGAAILIEALQDAGQRRWFTVLERNQLNDLLKERQIITEMRRIYRNETKTDPKVLPPLMHAGIIVEGGIVGYDTNTVTGGLGARYLGIGGDTKYNKDTVTVTLRAISTKTGEVLTSVNTRKEIASYALQGGAFRYLKLNELLEAETGVTYNEPKQLAVEAAIDKAVIALIVQGAKLGLWQFADPHAGQQYLAAYDQEQYKGELNLAGQPLAPPKTMDAADISDTHPLARQAAYHPSPNAAVPSAGQAAPQAAPRKILPPPPSPNEPPAG